MSGDKWGVSCNGEEWIVTIEGERIILTHCKGTFGLPVSRLELDGGSAHSVADCIKKAQHDIKVSRYRASLGKSGE